MLTLLTHITICLGRYICAWCGRDMGPSGTPEDSHGICPDCYQKKFGDRR